MNNSDVDAILDIPRGNLNDRQYAFCMAYARDPNGTRAAIAAGYSEATAASQASDLLKLPKVSEALTLIRNEYQKRAVAQTLAHQDRYSRDWVLSQLSQNLEIGRDTNQLSASNRAIELIGKAVHPGMLDRGDGANVQVLGENISFTMNIGSASGDDGDDVDVIDGSSLPLPMLDDPDESDE